MKWDETGWIVLHKEENMRYTEKVDPWPTATGYFISTSCVPLTRGAFFIIGVAYHYYQKERAIVNPYRKLRLEKGLSLREMAQALRINVSSIQALETGAPPRPYSTVEKALTEIMGSEPAKRLRAEYVAWRERQGEQTRKKLLQA